MKRDTEFTDVVFRVDTTKDFEGVVFALFPHQASPNGLVTTYQHTGQHSSADYNYCIIKSRPAKESEYLPLFKELQSIGYLIKVVKKQNYKKYSKSMY